MKPSVPLTVEQILEETRDWPLEQVDQLLHHLIEDLQARDPEVAAAWKVKLDRRIEEIESGEVEGIPVEESLARIRRILGR